MSSDIELSRTRLVVIISVAAWFLAALGAYLPGLQQTGPSSRRSPSSWRYWRHYCWEGWPMRGRPGFSACCWI
jgi:hypothetical protein